MSENGSNWSDLEADTGSSRTSYTHRGLTGGSARHYRVSAINSVGAGQPSSTANAITGAAPVPDLVVDTPTVDTSAPVVGARFTLSATVRNQGNGSSAFTTLRYYQSSDSIITTGDMAVGTDSVSSLDASESGDESVGLTAPSDPGAYYYGACVDAVSDESDTTNNCSVAVTVTVGAAPEPDLVVDTPTVDTSAPVAGARFTLSATVRNQGNGSSAFTTLRYYQSSDSIITTGDMTVGTDSVSSLDASESGDESVGLTAPSDPGAYYYGACVDAVSDESDTTNNCSVAVTVTVGAAPEPDLVVDTPTVDTSAPVVGARFTLSATVRNQGNGSSAFTTLRYYQSSDSIITTGDMTVGTDSVSSLDASESGDESVGLTAPSDPGAYYYGACVDAVSDESDTTNNCSVAVTVTVGAAPEPDLVVDTPTVDTSAPVVGARFMLSATVRNPGNGTSDSTTLRYYQSIDSTITTSDTEVSTDSVRSLNPSGSSDESVSLTAPSTPGTYHYGACVDAVSDESDTTNNCSVAVTVTVGAAPEPDLVVDTPTVDTSAPVAGARFTLSATVRNQGNGSSAFTTLRYYQSSDSIITTGDTEVGTDSVSSLNPSGSSDESVGLTAPSTPGTYHYGACVDAVSGESDTTNNCSVAVTVTVGAAPEPDLVVDTPTVDTSAPVVGARFTLSATVRNQGNGSSAFTTLRYYQSSDSIITTGDTEVGTDSVRSLNPSGSSDESVGLTAPSTPGTYYYGACVDSLSDEIDTQNNCSAAVAVTVGDVDTEPGAPTGVTATADGQTKIGLSWTAPSDDGGTGITGYHIEVSTDGSSWSDLVANTNSTSTSYSHTGLTAGTTRHYRVSAINSVGAGQPSNTANATTARPAFTCSQGEDPTPLHIAVDKRDVEAVRNLAGLCPDDLNIVSDSFYYEQTPLSLAIGKRDQEIVRILANAGADPNKEINPAFRVGTHLTYAVGLGDTGIVQILLDASADPNVVDTQQFYDQTPLSLAIKVADAEMMRKLIAVGADPNKEINPAFRVGTHLTYAVGLGDTGIVQILLDASADPNVVDTEQSYDQTPLSLAIKAADAEMMRKLIAVGADPNRQINPAFGVGTHLTYAVGLGDTGIVQILLDASADPNVVDTEQSYDQTPLSLAIKAADAEMMRKLIAVGADPNKQINPAFGVGTHLTYAVGLGDTGIVQILLDASADPNVVDTEQFYDESPLSLAVKAQGVEMVRILVAAGSDPNQKLDQSDEVSPLDIAIENGYTEIVDILTEASS